MIDMGFIGKRFERLVVMDFEGTIKGNSLWGCLCDCGNGTIVRRNPLVSGMIRSCGCLHRESASKIGKLFGPKIIHGHARAIKSPTYNSWNAMKDRCLNINHVHYPHYGGRGISICDRWMEFDKFLEDMGERPNGKSLDRIDVDGHYEPSNCRWASQTEQIQNRRKRGYFIERQNGQTT